MGSPRRADGSTQDVEVTCSAFGRKSGKTRGFLAVRGRKISIARIRVVAVAGRQADTRHLDTSEYIVYSATTRATRSPCTPPQHLSLSCSLVRASAPMTSSTPLNKRSVSRSLSLLPRHVSPSRARPCARCLFLAASLFPSLLFGPIAR